MKSECTSDILFTRDSDMPTQKFCQLAGNGKSQSCSAELSVGGSIRLAEGLKDYTLLFF